MGKEMRVRTAAAARPSSNILCRGRKRTAHARDPTL